MPHKTPDSLLGWLGRQVGFVRKAMKTDVTKPAAKKPLSVVYRADQIEEVPHPADPSLMLRRTTTDEVIENEKTDSL